MAKRAPRAPTTPDRAAATDILNGIWETVLHSEDGETTPEIRALISSKQVAIRYCLPTQLLGKLVSPSLDALCLQAGNKDIGQWDPRGFAARVISPWVLANQKVLGSSADPYVSNPLRRPRLDDGLDQMSDRDEWESLCAVLGEVQERNDRHYTETVFVQVLNAIRDRLREQTFIYIVPPRVSLKQAIQLVEGFLSERSGGDRGLSVTAALFEIFCEKLNLYTEVRRGMINAADAATGSAADLECIGANGAIVLAVEVKERQIGDADVQVAVAKARAFSVRELLLCTEGISPSDRELVEATFANAWASGTNIYHATILELMRGTFPLLGDTGTRAFVVQVGMQLDRFSTQPRHRNTWKGLLDAL